MLIPGAVVVVIDVQRLDPATHGTDGSTLLEMHLIGMARVPANTHHLVMVAVHQIDQLLVVGAVTSRISSIQAG